MNTHRKILAAVGFSALLCAWPAHAGTTYCSASNTPPPGSTVHGQLEVTAGNLCLINGVAVTGNLVVDAGGEVGATDSKIGGNVTVNGKNGAITALQAVNTPVGGSATFTGPQVSAFCGSVIRGNVEILRTAGLPGELAAFVLGLPPNPFGIACPGNTIGGSVSVIGNSDSAPIFVEGNVIGGSLEVLRNQPSVTLLGNAVKTNLSCSGNISLAGQGTNNVHGNESGQCEGF